MSNKGRVLTLVVTVEDEKMANDIWYIHGVGGLLSGCRVIGIADGDYMEDLDLQKNYLNHLYDENEISGSAISFADWLALPV